MIKKEKARLQEVENIRKDINDIVSCFGREPVSVDAKMSTELAELFNILDRKLKTYIENFPIKGKARMFMPTYKNT